MILLLLEEIRADVRAARLRACRTENPRLGKHLIGVVSDDRVAFTRDVFERRAIDDVDEAAAVPDQAGALQEAGGDGHGGAPHAEHRPRNSCVNGMTLPSTQSCVCSSQRQSLASRLCSALHATDCWVCASNRSL